MSSVDQDLHTYPDLFCRLVDALPRDAVRDHGAKWLVDRSVKSLSETFTADVEQGRPLAGTETRLNSVSPGDDRNRRIFAALWGLDRAFRHVHPTVPVRRPGSEPTPSAMMRLQAFVAATGRLDSGIHGGALLPRLVEPAQAQGDPDDFRDLFHYVLRVPPDSWNECEVVRLGEAQQLHPHEIASGIKVACVPVIADPAELSYIHDPERAAYRIAPVDADATLDRIDQIVTNLDASGATLAVAPELTLTPTLLKRWQAALSRRRSTRLRWVLAGSGPLRQRNDRPTNTAVLLDARTGRVIGEQDKQYAFRLSVDTLRLWKLESRLGSEALVEDIARGSRLTVFDAGAQRVAVLVCEDLSRVIDLGPLLRDIGISHVLAPVFSRPLKRRRWEQQASDVYVRAVGATVVVANSMVMQSILGRGGGAALVVLPNGDVLLESASSPAEPVCFCLLRDGSAHPC